MMDVGNTVVLVIGVIARILKSVASQNFEGFVVNGAFASVKDFPHSAFLYVECGEYGERAKKAFRCGSAILNQAVLLTAAHCLANCAVALTTVTAFVGHKKKKEGLPFLASSYKVHEKYHTRQINNDIALVRLKANLKFGNKVRRVALVRDTPYEEPAEIAGWGWINENPKTQSQFLMKTSQKVWSRPYCMAAMGDTPEGTICGGALNGQGYVAPGDSGSGLMVRKYILIGIVSYKVRSKTPRVAMYTEVSYFYDWIQRTAKRLYCRG